MISMKIIWKYFDYIGLIIILVLKQFYGVITRSNNDQEKDGLESIQAIFWEETLFELYISDDDRFSEEQRCTYILSCKKTSVSSVESTAKAGKKNLIDNPCLEIPMYRSIRCFQKNHMENDSEFVDLWFVTVRTHIVNDTHSSKKKSWLITFSFHNVFFNLVSARESWGHSTCSSERSVMYSWCAATDQSNLGNNQEK